MGHSNLYLLVSSFLVFPLLLSTVHASKQCYVVYLGAHSHGPTPSSVELETATYSHYDLLGSTFGSHEKAKEAIIYSYNRHINGFAAVLEEEEVAHLAKNPNVVSVFLSKEYKLHTTRSYEFLGLHRNGMNSAWQKGRFGENTIIANIDTGVWPESKSFSDEGIGPVPAKWRGGNVCQINKLRGSKNAPCNRKLIGARFFNKAYEAFKGKLPRSQQTARDFVGHGTHTLSTAGGNFVPGANVFGNGNGTAKGGSPRSRVATYKVCWSLNDEASCFGADVLAAIDHAIGDGVDVISISAGGLSPEEIFKDVISIGGFHALARNILLVTSAGNDGPTPGTVLNVAPWLFTVAASTIDRDFRSTLTFGNNQQITGVSLFVNIPPNQSFSLIGAANAKLANATKRDAQLCKGGTLVPAKAKGKIEACFREGKIKSVAEGQEALSAGAKGMILQNQKQSGNTLPSEPQSGNTFVFPDNYPENLTPTTPSIFDITATDSTINLFTTIMMSPAKTFNRRKPAPVMSSFASRGPNKIQHSILKVSTLLSELHVLSTVYHPPTHSKTTPPHQRTATDSTINSLTTLRISPEKTFNRRKPAPVMALFSSRGPNEIQPSILKPDITAPGVNILAAYSPAASASDLPSDTRRGFPFNVLQGTSMSCPHVAGIAGLLKTLHPSWSPAAIKSAIMTTATTQDNTNGPIKDEFEKTKATPFAYGSGHVQPDLAIDPGLVYDLSLTDYLNFLCASGYDQQLISTLNFNRTFICSRSHSITDLNYPSITLPNLGLNAVNVSRTVTNVGTPSSTYFANAQMLGFNIVVVPNSLSFKKIGEKKTFQVIVQARSVTNMGTYQFGELRWTNGKHIVRSPITVRRI